METLKSFKELADRMGYVPKVRVKKEKEIKCRVCGSPMRKVENTNIVVCTGTITKNDVEVPCKNFILFN